ncbi:MAG: hypothetical protein H0W88_05175 [Parachlamydiaceae bacterium]|nr:hypothetical protein [Parachlamydiaceae bacterium]
MTVSGYVHRLLDSVDRLFDSEYFDLYAPKMEITIADVESDESCQKLSENIKGLIRNKLVCRLIYAPLQLITLANLVYICAKLSMSFTKNIIATRVLTGCVFILITPFLLISGITVFLGIGSYLLKDHQIEYAKTVTNKVKNFFENTLRREFALTIDFDNVDSELKKHIKSTREFSKIPNWKNTIRQEIVSAIKHNSLASIEEYKKFNKISTNDPDWVTLHNNKTIKHKI